MKRLALCAVAAAFAACLTLIARSQNAPPAKAGEAPSVKRDADRVAAVAKMAMDKKPADQA